MKAVHRLCRLLGLYRPNFRGESIPAACGLTYLLGILIAAIPLSLLRFPGLSANLIFIAVAFGLLGLADDLWGSAGGAARTRGFRGHLRSLSAGRPTTGAIKLLVGGGLALWAASRLPTSDSLFLCGVNALLIALGANAINLLDLRPGRAQFAFLLFLLPGVLGVWRAWDARESLGVGIALLILLATVLWEWRSDAAGRSMMGDTGANLLGAVAGWLAAAFLPLGVRLSIVLLLFFLNLAAERVSLSRIIERTPWLRALDRRLGVR